MLVDIQQTEDDSRWLRWCSWIVLVAGLVLSTAAWWRSSNNFRQSADEAFARTASDIHQRVDQNWA